MRFTWSGSVSGGLTSDNELSIPYFLFLACHCDTGLWWHFRVHGHNHSFSSIPVRAPVSCPSMEVSPLSHKCLALGGSRGAALGLEMKLLMALYERGAVGQGLGKDRKPVQHLLPRWPRFTFSCFSFSICWWKELICDTLLSECHDHLRTVLGDAGRGPGDFVLPSQGASKTPVEGLKITEHIFSK